MRSAIIGISLLGLAMSATAQDAGEAAGTASGLATVNNLGAANIIWDESVDGDLSDRPTPTAVTLASMNDGVVGNVGGTGVDFDDCFIFTVPAGNSVTGLILADYVADGGNTTSGFNVYTGVPPDPAAFGDIFSAGLGPGDIGTDVLTGLTPLAGGDFTVCLLEGTPNQQYEINILSDIVGMQLPEPAEVPAMSTWGLAILTLLLAFGALFAVMRREKA
ncbi:MAG: hypothetical protein Tsb002_27480 [Wenzhouxiangellaceae bacterium]